MKRKRSFSRNEDNAKKKENDFWYPLFNQLIKAILLASCILPQQVTAGTMGSAIHQTSLAWLGTLSAGPVWQSAGSTQTLYLTPDIEKTYTANKTTQALFDGEFFLGLQKQLTQTIQGQLGVAVAATSQASLSGVILDDVDPQFDNYIYSYKIQHTHVAVKGKLLADAGFWLIPWVGASLGVGFNDAHGFHSMPTIFEALPTPDFASHTQTAFTYTVSAGVQKALNEHWQVGVGYEFADWGKNSLGRAREQTLNSGLTLNHFYTNGVLFNLTYLA